MFNQRLDLCDGIVASFNEEQNVFICYVHWLGRDIEIWLSAGDYNDDIEINSLVKTFEKFWNEKSQLLKASQNDVKEKIIPYVVKKNASSKTPWYPEVTVDDFDAEFWLTSVYVLCEVDGGIGEIQMNFYRNGDEDNDSFFVSRDLESGFLSFYVDMDMVTDKI
ncbi:MAG: hypothetical protein MJ084_04255 [Saccharofermentans sp.]|nr:hypothetical protein [Saccharofermentans sp.]